MINTTSERLKARTFFINIWPYFRLLLRFAILFLKVLNIGFPLILISLNVVERSLPLWMTSVIIGVNEKMLNLMPWRNGRARLWKLLVLLFHFTPVIHIFYPLNLNLLFGIWNEVFRIFMNYVLVPADKAAINIVVFWRLYYIDTLKHELVDTKVYRLKPSLSERVVVDRHGCHIALHFGVNAKENQDKVPTLNW